MIDNIIRVYCIGVSILLIAIIVNVIVEKLGVRTWYDFGPRFFSKGFTAIKDAGILNSIWLFIAYPLILGFGYIIGDKIYKLLVYLK